jgi:hypothetical protein
MTHWAKDFKNKDSLPVFPEQLTIIMTCYLPLDYL